MSDETKKAKRLFWIADAEYPEDSGWLVFDGADEAEARKKGAEWLGHAEDPRGVSVWPITAADVEHLQEMAERTQEIPGLIAALDGLMPFVAEDFPEDFPEKPSGFPVTHAYGQAYLAAVAALKKARNR